ncbi:MAG: DUF1153 domain-containing protein [Rhodobacteraceae bacterium]|nr:DUF1153 domain-containing protein [Paracoccaceae bacterium]
MYVKRVQGPSHVILSDGNRMTRSDLPPRDTVRWVARRKAAVVRAVQYGLISNEEACALYGLSPEELEGWKYAITRFGETALRATAIKKYRQL